MIMDLYCCQSSRVAWGKSYCEYFNFENGVKQCGVASPILFTVYLDERLQRLEKQSVGYWLGHE